jgi:acyl-CoA synthetase (NDP forming)
VEKVKPLSVASADAGVALTEMRDRAATAASLRPFFFPSAVAVVGASRAPAGIGYRILEALIANSFQGAIYPVNPRAAEICSLRAYASVRDIPEPVDLAVVAVPRDAVLGVVEE